MSFCSSVKGITPKILILCFVLIDSIILNLSCVWISKGGLVKSSVSQKCTFGDVCSTNEDLQNVWIQVECRVKSNDHSSLDVLRCPKGRAIFKETLPLTTVGSWPSGKGCWLGVLNQEVAVTNHSLNMNNNTRYLFAETIISVGLWPKFRFNCSS